MPKLIKTFSQESKKGLFYVKVMKNSETEEFSCVPFEEFITKKEQEEKTYFTDDKNDAFMTAAHMVDEMILLADKRK